MDKAIPIASVSTASDATRALELAEAWTEIEKISGPQYLRAAGPQDAIDGVQPQKTVEPGSGEELARVLAAANSAGLNVAPRGGGSKLGWGNPPRALDLIISTRRLNRVLEHASADLTASVESGCPVAELQRVLAEHGQQLAIDPLWPETATVGGMLATNDSGALRARFGSLRDLIIGLTLALPDGTLAKSGGKVVKNVAGYDLPKLITGSFGTLGIITQAIFRLHPLPKEVRTLSFTSNIADLNRLALAVLDSKLAYTGLQLRCDSDGSAYMEIRFAGTTAGMDAQIRELLRMAGKAREVSANEDIWSERQKLFSPADSALVAKFSVLPSEIARLCEATAKLIQPHGSWRLVAQGVGVGLLRLDATASGLLEVVSALRTHLARVGGSLVVLDCPAEVKAHTDVWGYGGDALALMARVKQQFDPAGTLNPGRFVGGL